jgi:hypothetical protein
MLNENQLSEISSAQSLLESDTDYLEMLANPGFRFQVSGASQAIGCRSRLSEDYETSSEPQK